MCFIFCEDYEDCRAGEKIKVLDFLKRIDPNNNIRSVDCDDRIENMIGQPENQECLKRIQALFPSNLWYNYFLKKSNMNQNWCDFESEIEYVDRKLEKINEQLEETRLLELRNLFEQENEILFGFMRYYLSSCEPNSKADDFCILQQGETRSVFGRKTFVICLTLGYQYDKGKIIPLGTRCRTLYIIGHSLTLNDRDILYELIMIKGMKTIIYYHSDASRINLMQNLAAILGNKNFTELMEYKMIQFEKGEFCRRVVEISKEDI